MSILNPQYAFLEFDFYNPNLTQVELKVENISEEVRKKSELAGNTKTALKIIPPNVYIKFNWLMVYLLLIPADIYFVAALLIAEILT